jgi:hypothetical protein
MMTGNTRYRLARRWLGFAILAMGVTSWWVMLAAGQYPTASVGAGEASAVKESAPSEMANTNDLPLTRLESSESSLYYWNSIPVGDSAQLLTLFCTACNVFQGTERDVPLVSLLRDTLGDEANENDRVTYIWLLTYAHPRLEQRILSAIPFFYWLGGRGSGAVSAHDTKPLMDLSAPEYPMTAQAGRDLLQWTAFDSMMTPVRASTQAYGGNSQDEERLHLEEAISYLRQAPVSNDASALTQAQLDTVMGRLELRRTKLGGLVNENKATSVGMQAGFEQERIRSRNWELLRQWAEKTGLIFEPMSLAGNQSQYAILWFPQKESIEPRGSSMQSTWRLLGIRNPWNDEGLKHWEGPVYERSFDENGSLKVIPLAIYSLNYPKLPLVMIDFREKLSGRRREMRQRSIGELTAGVFGLSHFANWYFYMGFDLLRFVAARRGKAVDKASRLDCYSEFRMELALDQSIDPAFKKDMEQRIRQLGVNPLEAAPQREIQDAFARYQLLESEAGGNGRLLAQVNHERRFELASFGQSEKTKLAKSMLHVVTLGLYKEQAKHDDISIVDRDRRVAYQLSYLDSVVQAETPPEVAYDSQRIKSSVSELSSLIPAVSSASVRSHAEVTLQHLKNFSKDEELRTECTTALALLKQNDSVRKTRPAEVAALSRGVAETGSSPNQEQ